MHLFPNCGKTCKHSSIWLLGFQTIRKHDSNDLRATTFATDLLRPHDSNVRLLDVAWLVGGWLGWLRRMDGMTLDTLERGGAWWNNAWSD